jgi:hypothetical protein
MVSVPDGRSRRFPRAVPPMTTAQVDPVRAARPGTPHDDVEGHGYTWYDPDAAAFDLDDPLADLEPLSDEDAAATVDWG